MHLGNDVPHLRSFFMILSEQFVCCSFSPKRCSGEDGSMNIKENESDLFKNVQAVRKGNDVREKRERKRKEKIE